MANKRETKKNINYIAGELFTECLIQSLYVPGTDKAKADEVMGDILALSGRLSASCIAGEEREASRAEERIQEEREEVLQAAS
jgi:hypothetical protein